MNILPLVAAFVLATSHAPSARLTFVLHKSIMGPNATETRIVTCKAGSARCAAIFGLRSLLLNHHGCPSNDTGLIDVTGRIGTHRVATFFGGCRADGLAWLRLAKAAGVRF